MGSIGFVISEAAPFIFLVIILMGFFVMISYGDSVQELKCRDYLKAHAYDFVKYHHSGLLGSPEECWGSRNGTSVRVY